MTRLALHPKTKQQLESLAKNPGHAILIIGPTGSGKVAVSRYLAARLLVVDEVNLDAYPYIKVLAPVAGKAIGIESVRELESFLSLKVPGNKAIDRVVIIEDSQLLGIEAQNALLKTLEEPPRSTVIVLTSNKEQSLLPTVRSRMQPVSLIKPARDQLQEHFSTAGFNSSLIDRSYALSGGLPGLMQALLADTEHPLSLATDYARKILQAPLYERLLLVDELSKQRALAQNVCFILQQMAHISLQTAQDGAVKRWKSVLGASYAASIQLDNSAQPKLALTNLMLNLS
jgi:hypothetical protein